MKKTEIVSMLKSIQKDQELKNTFLSLLIETLDLRKNIFHPLAFIHGKPMIGKNVYIGMFSEVNAKNANVVIGKNCDIASFVVINAADSHKKCLGIKNTIDRKSIHIGESVFIGSQSTIKGGAKIGHHSVVAAGTVVEAGEIPPYSLIIGNPMKIKAGYYKNKVKK
jgi:acetyltransferase-like isoleucine patch superfamily enzyme